MTEINIITHATLNTFLGNINIFFNDSCVCRMNKLIKIRVSSITCILSFLSN